MIKQVSGVATEWKPRQTWVFAVGEVEGGWPVETRRDTTLLDAFRALGVPDGNIVFLADSAATLETTEEQMAAHFGQAGPDDLAIFYFTGYSSHDGSEASFVLTDEHWPVRRIFALIEQHFTGSQALLLADTAHSGALAAEMLRRAGRVEYAVLASSVPTGCATGTWIYTNSLIEALEGAAGDSNGDGFVSLRDVAAYVEQQMAADAAKMPTFAATPGFPVGLCLAPVKARQGRVGEYVEARDQWGGWVPARIDEEREGEFHIRFCNYLTNPQAWVPAFQVRPWSPRKIPLGEAVQVISSDWAIGTVVATRAGLYLVHYENAEQADEWVGSLQIRQPSSLSALFPHSGGEIIQPEDALLGVDVDALVHQRNEGPGDPAKKPVFPRGRPGFDPIPAVPGGLVVDIEEAAGFRLRRAIAQGPARVKGEPATAQIRLAEAAGRHLAPRHRARDERRALGPFQHKGASLADRQGGRPGVWQAEPRGHREIGPGAGEEGRPGERARRGRRHAPG